MRVHAAIVCILTLTATLQLAGFAQGEICLSPIAMQSTYSTSTDSVAARDVYCNGDGYGGGGGSHTSTWTPNKTYTERNHTLERFTNFPVPSTSTGLVNLTSLPYAPPRTFAPGSLSGLTDEAIGAAMGALGLSTQVLSEQLEDFYAGNTSQRDRVATARQNIENGAYLAAVNTIASYDTNITLWCGDADNPVPYTWVILIPAVLPCPVAGTNRNLNVAALVPNVPDYKPVIDPNGNVWLVMSELNLTLTQAAPSTQASFRYTLGLQYLDLIWTMTTGSNKSVATAVNMQELEMTGSQADKKGWVYWNATSGSLQKGDNLTFTHGSQFRQEKNVNLTLSQDVPSFGAEYGSQALSNLWRLWLYYHEAALVQSTAITMVPRPGHQLVMSMANQTNGISFTSEPSTSMGRTREVMTIASAGGAFLDTEVKATYFTDTFPALDFQFKGLPGDENVTGDTTTPSKSILRLDFGETAEGGNFTFDLTRGTRSVGYYRALIITSRVPAYPFLATASHVDRVQYSGGAKDPWTSSEPFSIHSADLLQYESNSTFATSAGFSPTVTSTLTPTPNTGTPPSSNHWTLGPNATCQECNGTVVRGEATSAIVSGLTAKFWAIFASKTDETQLAPTFCPFTYPSSVECV